MKSFSRKKKILTGVAAIAVSAVAVCGFIGMSVAKSTSGRPQFTHTIRTAVGEAPQLGTGTTYYVAPAAKGTGDGLTAENAKSWYDTINTIENADPLLQPGDTVLFEEGVYTSTYTAYIRASGTYNNYITFKPATEGAEVVLDFSAQAFGSNNRGVNMIGDYIYWYGIDICGAGDNGMILNGSYCTIEGCEFYNNRDTGLQIARQASEQTQLSQWPNYDLILNCTSHNNYDNETLGENADGFASKLTVGYGIVFDGCIAYRNSDDGWDLFAKSDTGNIGTVVLYNCVAFENGFMEYTQAENNARFPTFDTTKAETNTNDYTTDLGDGNGFKLGGSVLDGDVVLYNCLSFNNRMHGFTDNSNPGSIFLQNITSYDNGVAVNAEGQIVYGGSDADGHNNIDMSRQTYSYNMIDGALSAKSGMVAGDNNYLGKDVIRGSVRNSILGSDSSGDKSYKYTDARDVDIKEGVNIGEEINAVGASAFTKVSVVMGGDASNRTYDYQLSGKNDLGAVKAGASGSGLDFIDSINSQRVDIKFRNSDGTVNMGEFYAPVSDDMLGNGVAIGAHLNKTSYSQYEHFTIGVVDTPTDEADYILKRAQETLTIATDAANVYQDFDVPANIERCDVTWESSKPEVVAVPDEPGEPSISGVKYYRLVVYRQQADTDVTITATITFGSGAEVRSVTKDFDLTVMAAQYRIGDIVAVPDGTELADAITDGGNIIVDLYSVFSEPQIVVYDGSDYNGKTLDPDLYNVTTKYEYSADAESETPIVIHGFTPSNAGIFTITKTIALKSDPDNTKTMTYSIHVASTAAKVGFKKDPQITLNTEGYILSGDVSNPTGTLYAVSSTERLKNSANPVTKENIQTYPGVESHTFRSVSVDLQYTNPNSGAYYIYYAFANLNGEVTTDIKEAMIEAVEIASDTEFMKAANGESVTGETPSSRVIYKLTKDISLARQQNQLNTGTFKGLLNGQGHTISNVTVKGKTEKYVGLFSRVNGGTIMNIKFKNVQITASTEQVGLIGQAESAYIHNVAIEDIKITSSSARIGALIGQVTEGVVKISQVSVKNVTDGYELTSSSSSAARMGGIIGYIQANSSPEKDLHIEISDCEVDINATGCEQIGGIVGSYNGDKSNLTGMYMEITHCLFRGSLRATKTSARRVGGIIGYQANSGTAVLRISGCFSLGQLYIGDSEQSVISSDKNCSGIFGGYDASADTTVRNCVALIEEYNTNYSVTSYSLTLLGYDYVFKGRLIPEDGITDKWTLHYKETTDPKEAGALDEPFVSLNFLGNWQ